MLLKMRNEYPSKMTDAIVQMLPPPPVNGLGISGGFELMVENRGNAPQQQLQQVTEVLIQSAMHDPTIADVFTLRESQSPSILLEIDRSHARAMGIPIQQVSRTLQSTTGSAYVNDFNLFGRRWQVNVQAEQQFRSHLGDIGRLEVRNTDFSMSPLRAFTTQNIITGPPIIFRYNIYESAPLMGRAQLGVSSGEAIELIDQVALEGLPDTMKFEWTGLSYMQVKAGNTAVYIFAMSVVFVFLVLAALYESWSLPLAIILVVPLGLLFSILGVWAFPILNVDIFTQIGFVVLVGLSCKNAVLIVEFAKQLQDEGKGLFEAVVEASHLRLRPIVMTSCAFVLGVVPLIIGSGAGAEMRRSLGIAMFCGMLGVTIFGVLLTPTFYYLIQRVSGTRLFTNPKVQVIGSTMLGFTAGMVVGVLLWLSESFPFWWAMLIGIVLGMLVAAVVLGVHRRRGLAGQNGDSITHNQGESS